MCEIPGKIFIYLFLNAACRFASVKCILKGINEKKKKNSTKRFSTHKPQITINSRFCVCNSNIVAEM